jgi:hypothetical protein
MNASGDGMNNCLTKIVGDVDRLHVNLDYCIINTLCWVFYKKYIYAHSFPSNRHVVLDILYQVLEALD